MAKRSYVKVGKFKFRRPTRRLTLAPREMAKATELLDEARRLIEKCGFLVKRSEFLHQQGLLFNNQAQELLRDCAQSGTHISAMSLRLDALEAKLKEHGRKRRRSE